MTIYELTRAAIDLMRRNPRLCIQQAIAQAAVGNASIEVAEQALELANPHGSITRFRAQLQADELLAQLNEAADEIDQLKGERLPVRREANHGAN